MSAGHAPFDPGLQPERTLLAWRRTCLALAVASAVVVRFSAEVIGPAAAVTLGMIGVVAAGAGYVRASARYRRAHDGLVADGELPIDGLALALVTLTLLIAGVAAGVYVVGRGLQQLL